MRRAARAALSAVAVLGLAGGAARALAQDGAPPAPSTPPGPSTAGTNPAPATASVGAADSLAAEGGPGAAVRSTVSGSAHKSPAPVDRATRLTGAITIDGKLDEPAWQTAKPITHFTQTQPVEGARPTQRTEIRVLYDAGALYIGARMYDSLGARGVRGRMLRRDQQLDLDNGNTSQLTSDKLTITLDPYHDHLTRAVFEINPSGSKGDALGAGGSNLDPSWDPVWYAATRVDSAGWTAEIEIPLSQLRFAPRQDSAQTWGLQVVRTIDRLNERDAWAFARRNENTNPATYGHLTGLVLGRPPRQFELLPYVSGRAEGNAGNAGDPLNPIHRGQGRAGGDVKYLLTSNITLDGTIYPDFGQVEVDPAVLNLSAFETFYPEKRPFFVSGAGAFDYSSFSCMFCSNTNPLNLFYSRRIGRAPQLGAYYGDRAAFISVPANTDILGAAKITGRTENGYTIGVLDAATNQESGTYSMGVDSAHRTVPMEPLSNYLVARVKRDFSQGATVVGGMFTSTLRNLDDSILSDSLHRHAEALGGDFITTWHHRVYSLMGSVAMSEVGGSPKSMLLTEESSAHYFQRPDRKSLQGGLFDDRLDSTATSLRGYDTYVRLGKDNGNWLWEGMTEIRSPGFEVNDLAFQRRADYVYTNVNLGYQWTVPGSWYRDLFAIVGSQEQHNFDGDRTDLQFQAFLAGDFKNFWGFKSFYIHHPTVMDDQLTRGGPVVKRHGYDDALFGMSTDSRKWLVLQGSVEGNIAADEPGQELIPQIMALVKPAPNVSFTFGPTLDIARNTQQYDTALANGPVPSFGNTRYVFATVRQTTLSLDTRLNVAFTPVLTLDVYAQPFLASGHYSAFKQFDHPRQLHKSVYGVDVGSMSRAPDGSYCIDPNGAPGAETPVCGGAAPTPGAFAIANPDFNTRSLRGNAVLRWEFHPGSTVYLVWQQTRADDTVDGNFAFGRDQSMLFRAPADNVFLIKFAYWVGL